MRSLVLACLLAPLLPAAGPPGLSDEQRTRLQARSSEWKLSSLDHARAVETLRDELAKDRAAFGDRSVWLIGPRLALAAELEQLATSLEGSGQAEKALQLREEVLALKAAALGPD